MQGIVRKYYEQLYANELSNLDEMDKFLEMYNLPKLNWEELENLNSHIKTSETEAVMKRLLANQSPGPDCFTGEVYKTFREGITPLLLKLFHKTQEKGILPNSFYKPSISLISKPGKDTTKKENYRPISVMNIDANILNKISAN